MNANRIVIFGAGKIGRSFIGQIFGRCGYDVVFVDVNRDLIDLLNERRQYHVVVKDGDRQERVQVDNVKGYCLDDEKSVIDELVDASLAAFSVGRQGLPAALSVVAGALVERRRRRGDAPLDIIIAENMRNADLFIRNELRERLPVDYPLDGLVGLIETSIGKMVPIMTSRDLAKDPLQVFAEPYNTLIVAQGGFRNRIPDIPFLAPKENIKAWVDRKLFIHNLGHAAVAYLGYRAWPKRTYIWEVLEDGELARLVRQTMLEAADILRALHPGEFYANALEEHIDDLLRRFKNRGLGDTVFRVGCDLYRKLGPEDRLSAPIRAALSMGKPCQLIVNVIVAAVGFRAADERGAHLPADETFLKEAEKGVGHILSKVCLLPSRILDN